MAGILDGKVALVTGAGHGIGRGHALELARQGAKVVINDLGGNAKGEGEGRDADVVVDIIKSRGGEAVADYGNVGDEAAAEAMVKRGIDEWGRLDIVVNNAGIVRDKAIWNMSADDFDLVMNVHLRGTWLTCRAAAQHWRAVSKAGSGRYPGRIINTTSGAGLLGNFGQTNYAAAKAGIAGLTLTLAVELAAIGVTANLISPGGLTRISSTLGMGAPKEPDDFGPDEFDPLDPSLGSPAVAWLASDEAQMVSGQCIRAVRDRLSVLKGWHEAAGITSGGKRWKTEEIGKILATDLFGTRAPGLRMGG
ncbi:MAG: short-chain dehydrogenase [Rhodobacterales bacterium 32-66-9]|nr:MAG: short-chain dehydrogenase [Rhodobacterales bacterium 32-66-9]